MNKGVLGLKGYKIDRFSKAQTTVSTEQTTSSTSYVDVTNLTASLPFKDGKKSIDVSVSLSISQDGTDGALSYFNILRSIRGGVYVSITGDLPLLFDQDHGGFQCISSYNYIDAPSACGTIKYKVQVKTNNVGSTLKINTGNAKSVIKLREIS